MKLCFLGASNPETIRMLRALEHAGRACDVVGFIDNDPARQQGDFHGYPVLGGSEMVDGLAAQGVRFVNLITGSAVTRYETSRDIIRRGGLLENFLHPSVDLDMVQLGFGNYIQEAVILQAGVVIGDNSSLHMGAKVGHETVIGSSTFIAHEVSISGCCVIGDGVFVGTNATILPRIRIGNFAMIGAGAVVTKDVPDGAVIAGNPGRVLRIDVDNAVRQHDLGLLD